MRQYASLLYWTEMRALAAFAISTLLVLLLVVDRQIALDSERIVRLYISIVTIGAVVGGIPLLLLAAPVYALALRTAKGSWPLAIGCGLFPGLFVILAGVIVPGSYSFRALFNSGMAAFVSIAGLFSMCAIHALRLKKRAW
jgi:hypothetical protein